MEGERKKEKGNRNIIYHRQRGKKNDWKVKGETELIDKGIVKILNIYTMLSCTHL